MGKRRPNKQKPSTKANIAKDDSEPGQSSGQSYRGEPSHEEQSSEQRKGKELDTQQSQRRHNKPLKQGEEKKLVTQKEHCQSSEQSYRGNPKDGVGAETGAAQSLLQKKEHERRLEQLPQSKQWQHKQQRFQEQQRSKEYQQQKGEKERHMQPHFPQQSHQRQHTPLKQWEERKLVSHQEQQLSPKSRDLIARGAVGNSFTVQTNYLEMDLRKMPPYAYHYDVTIIPDRPKKFMRNVFEQFNNLYFQDIAMAYDGKKTCYTPKQLEQDSYEHTVEIEDSNSRRKEFKVAIKSTKDFKVDLSSLLCYYETRVFDKPMGAMQCLEVVLASACHSKGIRVGRSFFVKPREKIDLCDGFEMWIGLYQAAILGDKPFLNVDISHKSFYSDCNIIDYMQKNFRNINFSNYLQSREVFALRNFLNGMNVTYYPPTCFQSFPRTYKFHDVVKSAKDLTFDNGGKVITVANYYAQKGFKLRYPGLNCLHLGSPKTTIYIPIELCSIPGGQAVNKKDGKTQVSNMIKYAATSTSQRKRKIFDILQNFNHNSNKIVKSFGIQIGTNFISVQMRILPTPCLEYSQNQTICVKNGVWEMGDNKFFRPQILEERRKFKWAIILENINLRNDLECFAQKLLEGAKQRGVNLSENANIQTVQNIASALKDLKSKDYDLVIVVLPERGITYAAIKQEAELTQGILTQCIKEKTLKYKLRDSSLVTHLLLKINCKLNGTNHKISEKISAIEKVMFLGADVAHPSPDQKNIPSVVGVAASHDLFGACYNMQYRLQKSTQEEIFDMESIVRDQLQIYYRSNGFYPKNIMYYRDGVSDGQFPKIKQYELTAIRNACKRINTTAQSDPIKLTCIVVVKRHHTRFFPQKGNMSIGKYENVPPGSIADQYIVHPNEIQWFLVSHVSVQGTAKPTRYNVIDDDAALNIDLLHKITYDLCHMFPRCNRSVSYPAPAYLAHVAASRARVYIDQKRNFGDLKKLYEQIRVNPEFLKRNPMYFV